MSLPLAPWDSATIVPRSCWASWWLWGRFCWGICYKCLKRNRDGCIMIYSHANGRTVVWITKASRIGEGWYGVCEKFTFHLVSCMASQSTPPTFPGQKVLGLATGIRYFLNPRFSLRKASWSPCFFGNVRAGVGWLVIIKYIPYPFGNHMDLCYFSSCIVV